jgi:hypothetical protein
MADEAPRPPEVIHKAPAEFEVGASRCRLRVVQRGDWTARTLELRVRRPGGVFSTIRFLRTNTDVWIASIPQEMLRPPGLEYAIYSVDKVGAERAHFASEKSPHHVIIRPSAADLRHDARLESHEGNRSRFQAVFSQRRFGRGRPSVYEYNVPEEDQRVYSDYFNVLELDYTYRFLKDRIYSISFGYGMVGGKVGIGFPNHAVYQDTGVNQGVLQDDQPERPGVYYGYAKAYWEIAEKVGLEPTLVMGASYDGFEAGFGLLARLGRVTDTNLAFSLLGISSVGIRFATEFEWQTIPHVPMSLRYELTDFPTGEGLATLASYNIRFQIKGAELIGAIGYGTRRGYEEGGLSFTGGLAWNF